MKSVCPFKRSRQNNILPSRERIPVREAFHRPPAHDNNVAHRCVTEIRHILRAMDEQLPRPPDPVLRIAGRNELERIGCRELRRTGDPLRVRTAQP